MNLFEPATAESDVEQPDVEQQALIKALTDELHTAIDATGWEIVHASQWSVCAELRIPDEQDNEARDRAAAVVGNSGGWWWIAYTAGQQIACNHDDDRALRGSAAAAIRAAEAVLVPAEAVLVPAEVST